jgi:ureidoacrylate peracid hydrolase
VERPPHLRLSGAKHLIITGCTTSICVESTIRDAFFRDYHRVLLQDCAAEPMGRNLSRSNHEATVLLIERIFGSVSSSTNFINAVQPAGALTA